MVQRAFSKANCEVKSFNTSMNINTLGKIKLQLLEYKLRFSDLNQGGIRYRRLLKNNINSLLNKQIMNYNKKLLNEIKTIQPDILLAIKGDILLPETLKKIKGYSNTVLVIWCCDTALIFNNVLDGGKYYHLFYTFETDDIPELKRYNIDASFLPMAYDPETYFKIRNENPQFDVSFVGALNKRYPNRKEILEAVISQYEGLNLGIWGRAWTCYNPYSLFEFKIKRRLLVEEHFKYDELLYILWSIRSMWWSLV